MTSCYPNYKTLKIVSVHATFLSGKIFNGVHTDDIFLNFKYKKFLNVKFIVRI